MAKLKTYTIDDPAAGKYSVQLSDDDARARGLLADEPEEKADAVAHKARTAANKAK